jgi:hypothetical protein
MPWSRNAAMNSGGMGDSSPKAAITAGFPARTIAGSSACTLSIASLGEPGTIGTHRLPIAGSARIACAVRVQIVVSRSTCAVTSTGLSGNANGGSAALRLAFVAAPSSGISRPSRSQKSSAKPLIAPELVMMPGPFTGGLKRASSSAVSTSSSRVSTTTTAAWRSSAVITA